VHMQVLEAFGESRFKAKNDIRELLRAAGEKVPWTVSTGKMHSWKTSRTYTDHIIRFAKWVKQQYGVRHFPEIQARYSELAISWLLKCKERGDSPYSLQAYRSALRMCFGDRNIGVDLKLGTRKREAIKRSRLSVSRDLDFNPENHRPIIDFLTASGLRRREIETLLVGDMVVSNDQSIFVNVRHGKNGKTRQVPIIAGMEKCVLAMVEGRAPEERIYINLRAKTERGRYKVPSHLDVHSLRRSYAQVLYCQLSGRDLPPVNGILRREDYDMDAVLAVSKALGHARKDVVLKHYIR
jgi:integrase